MFLSPDSGEHQREVYLAPLSPNSQVLYYGQSNCALPLSFERQRGANYSRNANPVPSRYEVEKLLLPKALVRFGIYFSVLISGQQFDQELRRSQLLLRPSSKMMVCESRRVDWLTEPTLESWYPDIRPHSSRSAPCSVVCLDELVTMKQRYWRWIKEVTCTTPSSWASSCGLRW